MRLTALCVCGTLLAFSSLPWIRAEEGVLLGDCGFGPCAATLKPEGACRQGQHGSTCPYLLSLPPLTVHLPHLRELEDIMQDLQKLKDSVDELRKMCAGCESHNDRRCGRQTEREHDKQTEGKSTRADVRNWMNVRPETERDFNLECGNDAVKVEKTDTEKRVILEEEERHKWETDRKGNKGAVKEKEREESLSEVRAKDGKPKGDGARGKDVSDQKRTPTAGGNTRTVDVTSENVFETDHREVDRIKDALKGNLKGFQEDKLESEDEKKILTNVKNKEKTKEESNIHVWQEDINKTSRTEAGDKTKLSENRGDHRNEEQEEQEGETREEMETGIIVGRNNENPKQTESTGRSGKEKTLKEGEVDDKDREIKAESVQRDGDGELSSRKTTERTDFFPISPTPLSITRSTSRLDPSKVTTLTSSLPSPSFPSFTLSSITDVSHESKGVYGLTKSLSHGAGDTSKTQGTDVTTATGTTATTTTEQPSTGSRGHERSTTTTYQTLRVTASPNVTDRSRWTPKKNISSNIRSVEESPPGPGLKPGQKIKPEIKPEAEQKRKNLKNDHKPNQAPIPDKKTKYNQKQKSAPHKPTSEKPKTGRDPKQTHITKPNRRAPPYILVPNKNQKNNLTRQHDLTLRNKLQFHKPKPPQRPPTSVQIPQPVNSTHSEGHPLGNKDLESDKTPDVDQNSKPEKKLIHPFKTNKPDQKKKTEKTLESEEKTKLDDKTEQISSSAQRTSTRTETEHLTPKPNQKHQTESAEITGENASQEPKSKPDSTAGAEVTPHRVHSTSDGMKNFSQEITGMKPESNRELVTSQMKQKPLSESVRNSDKNHSQKSESKPGLKLGQKLISGRVNATSDQINHSSQAIAEIKHNLNPTKAPKGETVSSKPDQKLLGANKSVENPSQVAKSIRDLTPEQKITISRVHETSDQMNQASMETTEIKHKPERIQEPGSKRETATSKPNEKHSADNVETSDGNPIQEPGYQVNATPDSIPESNKTILDIKVEKETTPSKPNGKPLTIDTSIQSLLLEPTFIPELMPEKKITSDEVNASSGQTNESTQGVIGKQPKPSHQPESESDTTTSQPDHVFSTESVKRSEKYSYKEPESNTDMQSGQKITLDQVNATFNQMNTSKQEIPKIKHKPKLVQKPESKNEAVTSKPDLKLLTVEMTDENSLKEQEFNPDIKSEKRPPFDQVNRTSGQMNKPIQERPDQMNKPIQERPDQIKKSIKERPDQIKKSIKERPDQIKKSIKERPDQIKKSIKERPDQIKKSIKERPDQIKKSIKERPDQIKKSIKERPDQMNKFIQERPDQMNKSIQERPDQMNKTIQERPDQIKKPIQERPDQINKSIQERPDQINKSIQERPNQINKSIQERPNQINKSIQERPNQINKSIQERPDQMNKTIQERPDQINKSIQERPNQINKSIQERPDQINKSIQERPDQINKSIQERPDQMNKSIQERPDQMNKFIQERPDQINTLIQERTDQINTLIQERTDQINKSIQGRPDQMNKSIQGRPDHMNKSIQGRPDQMNKSIQGRPTIKYRPKPIPKPESKSKTATPKHKQKPLTKFVGCSDQIPPHTPKFNPDLTPGQKITSDRGTVVPDQINKPRLEIKIKTKPKPSQEPKFESETATSKPLAEFVDGSEEIPSNEPKLNLDLTPEQKFQSNLINGTSDQIDKPSQEIKQQLKSTQDPESKSETASSRNDQKTVTTHKLQKVISNQELTSGQTPASGQNPKHVHVSSINKRPKPGSEPNLPPKHPKAEMGLKHKPDTDPMTVLTPQTNSSLRTPRPGQKLNLKPVSLYEKIPTPESNRTSKPRPPFRFRPPSRHIGKPGPKLIQRPKQPIQPAPSPKTKTALHPSKTNGLPSENIPNSQTDVKSPSDLGKLIAEVTHSPRETSSNSTRKTHMLGPKTSNSLNAEHLPHPYTNAEDIMLSPNSRTASDLRPQTASQPPSIPMTTRPNTVSSGMLRHVFTSTNPGPTQQSPVPKSDSLIETKILHYVKETAPETTVLRSLDSTFTPSSDLRSEASTTSDPKPFAAQPSTPSARELRVKINQVAAFVNNSLNPNGRLGGGLPKERPEGSQSGSLPGRINGRLPTSVSSKVPRDCSDLLLRGKTTSGVYLVTPDLRSRSFPVFCDMVLGGGGWTLLQSRQDGSVSFNRTWMEYQTGFGVLDGGEFWLGNNMIHLLTRDRDMMLRVELEDFDGVTGFAQYELFRVAGERLRYRLTVDGYSGTAGDALRFSKRYDHNNRAFTTPDRDHDRYPSGNCGAYYSSGWWFDACMAANLNGRYYNGKYRGVRDGIFWGTWYNISEEYYPTNERLSFKSVRMMIRPKAFMQ
ncbi:titin-like [Nothobranchius furzeri]|uniref:Titin-like n=1 Tax=Nothobranchius furzeri TaxID=105023 RepID=A0A9D2YRN0_NOTFU|nr:titin-like [Nothobranchius furzeri]